jgi:NodT family efflux transporter outer membrane factor (OMF) lipoprotein
MSILPVIRLPLALAVSAALALGGCSLAPVYQAPTVKVAGEQWTDAPWQPARPADALPRGAWWRVYGDPVLDDLEARVDAGNPDLAAALARYDQALAYAGQARAAAAPQLDASGSYLQNRQSDDRPLRSAAQPSVYGAHTVQLAASYDLDLWGRVRNLVAAGSASAQASAAEMENVRLSLHAHLADNYVRLRGVDAQARLLDHTIRAYARALALTQNRHDGGIASGIDVARATTQLRSVRSQADQLKAERAVYEHAIASLLGQPAMRFTVAAVDGVMDVPAIPTGLPSTLLQRRPDVAAAERRAAAANAGIGVARAAYYPDLSLGGSFGYQNTASSGLLSAPERFWSIGPGLAFNVFDGGLRDAKLAAARAALEQAGADYRSIALAAFQQVEDDMAHLKYDRQGELEQNAAVASAQQTLTLALNRYREGAVNYLEVVTAQADALSAQRGALQLRTRQLRTSVDLIRALGGGWSAPDAATAVAAVTSTAPPRTTPHEWQ